MPDELAQQLEPLKELLRLLGYTLVTCEGYEADDILAQDGAVVPSFDELITPIALNHFGPNSHSGDPNVVWCRNDVLKIDYQITRFEGSYQHYVLGIPEDRAYDPPHKFNKERAAAMEETYDDNRGRI